MSDEIRLTANEAWAQEDYTQYFTNDDWEDFFDEAANLSYPASELTALWAFADGTISLGELNHELEDGYRLGTWIHLHEGIGDWSRETAGIPWHDIWHPLDTEGVRLFFWPFGGAW